MADRIMKTITDSIKDICSKHPDLGIGGFEGANLSNYRELVKKLDDIVFIVEWLAGIEKTNKITGKCGSSQRLSHIAGLYSPNKHIDNGVFIIGAIIAGFRFARTNIGNGSSACFNMSCRSIQRKIGKCLPFETGYSCLGV
jgi:hypothetical protein